MTDRVVFDAGREPGELRETAAAGLPEATSEPTRVGKCVVPAIRVEAGRIGMLRFDSAETGG
ncbi:hypothetical protein MCAG_04945 [Micromonospora sp. ATCC 39149]|nr:hypothetical protein MCAG_04945 [Micromonospora sp. ATCC 39149]